MKDLAAVSAFLAGPTPDEWIDAALKNHDVLLIDHANCEKKAASTALNLIYRYTEHHQLLTKMSKLAREELRHFEQVIQLMKRRGVAYEHVSACDYAGEMRRRVQSAEPHRLTDTLIASAFIEARSCERFAKLAEHVDAELAGFYRSLLKSESRHFLDYLNLAEQLATADLGPRVSAFRQLEGQLIARPCVSFRFHSGPVAD